MKTLALFLYTIAFVACAALTPPPVDGMPCGPRGISCGNGACCDDGYSCIPNGLCAFTEDNPLPAAKAPKHQYTETLR
jgi:hypothetical protein